VPERLGDRGFQVEKVDRLGHEIECTAVHCSTDIDHVAVRDTMMVDTFPSLSCSFCSSDNPAIRGMLMSVTTRSIPLFAFSAAKASTPSRANKKGDGSVLYLLTELLQDESLDVWLVINDQNACAHAARSTRVSISLRSSAKSIGLVSSASAPASNAFRFVSASP
jgi:hypothetical protein